MPDNALYLMVTVPKTPAGLVTRVVVSCGYVVAGTDRMVSVAKTFTADGGLLQEPIQLGADNRPPDKVTGQVTVDYDLGAGISGFSEAFEAPVTIAGCHYYCAVPTRLDRDILVSFSFLMMLGDRLQFRWDHLVDGSPVAGEVTEVVLGKSAGAWHPQPESVRVAVKTFPGRKNILWIKIAALDKLSGRTLKPYAGTFPLDAQAIGLSVVRDGEELKVVAKALTTG